MTNPPSEDLSAPPASTVIISDHSLYAAHTSGSRVKTADCNGSNASLHRLCLAVCASHSQCNVTMSP